MKHCIGLTGSSIIFPGTIIFTGTVVFTGTVIPAQAGTSQHWQSFPTTSFRRKPESPGVSVIIGKDLNMRSAYYMEVPACAGMTRPVTYLTGLVSCNASRPVAL